MTRLNELFDVGGQSPWIDDLKRSYLTTGELERLIGQGIRGMTTNPTIMTKAIEEGHDYDEQFGDLVAAGSPTADAYWDLVIADVEDALGAFRKVYDASNGGDGFVSIEVAPDLAQDTDGTIRAALDLHARINQPNLFVKIPATKACLPAIESTIAAGHSVNVTLIFSLERYDAVISAYLNGLERLHANGGNIRPICSVASFFVSRVDTEVDRRLEAIEQAAPGSARAKQAHQLLGQAASAQARLAYGLFRERFSTPQAKTLLEKGARLQRPLWASTSTKNPSYPDLLYVDGLIGPDTVNTMPKTTIEAFLDHGQVQRTIDSDEAGARATLANLADIGVDLEEVTAQLESEGLASFAKSFDELQEQLAQKALHLGAADASNGSSTATPS